MVDRGWTIHRGTGPLVATAVHDGHEVRDEVARYLAVDDAVRLREEDPFTAELTRVVPSRVVVHRSRFEADMNRPREGAVYRRPEDAWGIRVWEGPPPEGLVRRSLDLYDAFYADLRAFLEAVLRKHGRFVVYDIHSSNHRREGPHGPPASAPGNPEINVGTGPMPRERWAPVVEAFMRSMASGTVDGRALDVRENVRFQGGEISRWIHRTFPERGCCLAVEVKKFYMDEWTGEVYPDVLRQVGDALAATVRPVRAALRRVALPERRVPVARRYLAPVRPRRRPGRPAIPTRSRSLGRSLGRTLGRERSTGGSMGRRDVPRRTIPPGDRWGRR